MVVESCDRTALSVNNNNKSYFSINGLYDINNVSTSDAEENDVDLTPVQEFYNEGKVFITGSTGFLGKVLVEKLLRSCPTINTLFLLIRSKKGKDVEKRTDEMFEDVVFDLMKKACPKYRHKIVTIAGDCALPDLGLSKEDRKRLIEEVNIVFHVAATVRFDEKLTNAVPINVRGSREVLQLAKEMLNLKVLLHVSTIYSNCLNKCIEEKVYEPAMEPGKLISLVENVPTDILEAITPKLLGKYPNTYTYTKQVAESIIAQEFQKMPVGIIRPGIVISSYKEPIPSWTDNFYGAAGVIIGAGTGLLRTLHCDPEVKANLIPVDMCVNSIIVTSQKIAKSFHNELKTEQSFKSPVFNCGCTEDRQLTWHTFMNYTAKYGVYDPPSKAIWYFSLTFFKYYPVYLLMTFILHTLPAMLIDSILFCTGRKPKMMALYKKIHKLCTVLSYFCTKEWQLRTENLQRVQNELDAKDQKLFFTDITKVNWDDFYRVYAKGVRIYALKDPMDTVEKARLRYKKLYYIHQTVKTLSYMALLWLSFWLIKILF